MERMDQVKESKVEVLKARRVKVLGEGAYGVVYLEEILSPVSGFVAVKSTDEQYSSYLLKEEKILRHLKGCRNIIRCFGGSKKVEDDGRKTFKLFLEYATGGTLSDLMNKYGGIIPESDVRSFTRMILQGLVFIHEKGLVHSDLKPQNVLVFNSKDKDGNKVETLKIADFGLAKANGILDLKVRPYGFRGTPYYMSPESIAGEISGALDIWSLGCIVVEMVSGKLPWPDDCDLEVLSDKLLNGKETPVIPKHMSTMGKNFLMRCFNFDPDERWTASMLLNHPYLLPQQTICQLSTSFLEYGSTLSSCPPSKGLSSRHDDLPRTSSSPPYYPYLLF